MKRNRAALNPPTVSGYIVGTDPAHDRNFLDQCPSGWFRDLAEASMLLAQAAVPLQMTVPYKSFTKKDEHSAHHSLFELEQTARTQAEAAIPAWLLNEKGTIFNILQPLELMKGNLCILLTDACGTMRAHCKTQRDRRRALSEIMTTIAAPEIPQRVATELRLNCEQASKDLADAIRYIDKAERLIALWGDAFARKKEGARKNPSSIINVGCHLIQHIQNYPKRSKRTSLKSVHRCAARIVYEFTPELWVDEKEKAIAQLCESLWTTTHKRKRQRRPRG